MKPENKISRDSLSPGTLCDLISHFSSVAFITKNLDPATVPVLSGRTVARSPVDPTRPQVP